MTEPRSPASVSRIHAPGPLGRLVVVTGMSGAGKSTALHALEDLNYYCVDNLPTPLIRETLDVCATGGLTRVALGVERGVSPRYGGHSTIGRSPLPSPAHWR